MNADRHRKVYWLTYVGVTALWMAVLYLVLHTWLEVSALLVGGAMLAVAGILMASFVILFLTATVPSAEQRLAARAKYGFRLLLAIEFVAAGVFSWMIRVPGWEGWALAASAFVVAGTGCGFASWVGYRNALKRIHCSK